MAQSKSRRQQISAVTRETNMEMGTFSGGLHQGWSVEKDQRAWKGLSAPRVGADNRAEWSSCLISQSVLKCTVRRRTLVLSPRKRAESPPRGQNLQSLSRRNETEAISHLDGFMDYLQKVPQLICQSAATQQRERWVPKTLWEMTQEPLTRPQLSRGAPVWGVFSRLWDKPVRSHTSPSLLHLRRDHTFKSLHPADSGNACVILAWPRFSAKLHCFHDLLTICVVCKSSSWWKENVSATVCARVCVFVCVKKAVPFWQEGA